MKITDAEFWAAPNRAGLPTFSYAELLAQLQQDIIPGGGGSPFAGLGANYRDSGTILVPNNTLLTIPWGLQFYDDLGFFNPANPTRLTIPVTVPAISRVQISTTTQWSVNQTGTREVVQGKNGAVDFLPLQGASMDRHQAGGAVFGFDALSTYTGQPRECVPGDYFEIFVNQNSGVQLTVDVQVSIVVLR